MAQTIDVRSTVAQADGFSVEVKDTSLICNRYFPTTAGDEFAGKEVLFDFDSSDLEKGAFVTSGYKDCNTVSWIANAVVPPRVANQESVDPTDQDRMLFERLCRAQGADTNRAAAYQDLLNIKAARLAKRTDRAREVLGALVLKEGKISFDQDKNTTAGSDTDLISCKFYDSKKGADNHYVVAKAWTEADAKPYDDVCAMVNEGMKRGRAYEDLLLGANAWSALSRDERFMKFAGATFHSEGMIIDFGDVEGAQHVARAVFNGVQLNVIVYSGAYKNAAGELVTFIDPNAAILISSGIGRGLQGGCTLLNPDSIGYGIENSFVGMTGIHMQSIFKDFNNQKIYLREESRPLPAPRHSVNEWDWIYCDTSLANAAGARSGEVYKGVSIDDDKSLTWATASSGHDGVCFAGDEVTVTKGTVSGKTVKLYAVRDGKPAEELKETGSKIVVPVDSDRDEEDKAIIFATAV